MYLRAERRHLAEVAAARLLETRTPVATFSVARPPEAAADAAPTVLHAPVAGSEVAVEPASTIAPARSSTPNAFRNPDLNPLASFRSEIQADLRLVKPAVGPKPAASVTPFAPVQPARTPLRIIRDQRTLLPVAMFGAVAISALIIIAVTIWPRGNAGRPAQTASGVAKLAGAEGPGAPLVTPPSASPESTGARTPTGATGSQPQPTGLTPPTGQASGAAVVTPSAGQLRITSVPNGARVTINGIGWGQTPVTVSNLPLGTKTVRLTSDGYASQQRTIELSSGDTSAAVHVALRRSVNR